VVSQAQPSGLPTLGEDEHTHTFEVVCSRVPTGFPVAVVSFDLSRSLKGTSYSKGTLDKGPDASSALMHGLHASSKCSVCYLRLVNLV
jgi:hypothetical protein